MDQADSLVHHLAELVRCRYCGASYCADSIHVLGRMNDLWYLTARCEQCHTKWLLEVSTEMPVAEPPPNEGMPAKHDGPITEQDVADMHELLAHFQGNLADLLRTS